MEDNTSEVTSPNFTSRMAYGTTYHQLNFGPHTNLGIVHSQANNYQLFQGEPSEASERPRPRCCRPRLSESQKRENRRQSDIKYRQNQKIKINELIAENQCLREENGRLTDEKRCLEECLKGLQSKGKLPAEDTQRQDSHISQPACQLDHQCINDQDHHGVDSNYVAVDRDHCRYSDIEGAIDRNDGMALNELLLLLEKETNKSGRVAIHKSAPENQDGSLSDICPADVDMTEFLMKLDEEVPSQASFSDFTGIDGEHTTFGRYSFPFSLIPTIEKINDAHGDVSATSLINPTIAGEMYILFSATIKEMDDLLLEQVTEEKMIKWRDTIKDALRINFNVQFAMDHLKKIACAYFGRKGSLQLHNIDAKISKLDAELNDWKKKRAEIYEGSKLSMAAAEELIGVPVSTGLFA